MWWLEWLPPCWGRAGAYPAGSKVLSQVGWPCSREPVLEEAGGSRTALGSREGPRRIRDQVVAALRADCPGKRCAAGELGPHVTQHRPAAAARLTLQMREQGECSCHLPDRRLFVPFRTASYSRCAVSQEAPRPSVENLAAALAWERLCCFECVR